MDPARFLGIVAHELSTPLTPQRLQLQLLESGALGRLNARQRKSLAILSRNVARMRDLVQELLDVGRLEGGGLRVRSEPVDVAAAVAEAAEAYEEAARSLGVRLEVRAAPTTAQGDRDRIVQVLSNLVSNALKFTPAGGRVAVAVRGHERQVEVRVEDSGAGMTPQQLAGLFQPFSRPLAADRPDVKGTGLGLFICQGLAIAMGGTLAAESAGPGQGSAFTLTLPKAGQAKPKATTAAQDDIARRLREIM